MYTWREIDENWLLGAQLALSPDEVTRAFNTVAERFGREWVEARHLHRGLPHHGILPTIRVVRLGQQLATLDNAPGSAHLLAKVREGIPDALAELSSIHLVCAGDSTHSLEVEPDIVVGARNRKPDFRVRQTNEDWTYVEVAQPCTSDAQATIRRHIERLCKLADTHVGNYALEIFLRRAPGDDEVEPLVREVATYLHNANHVRTELSNGLGTLYWGEYGGAGVTLEDHSEPYTPRLGAMRAVVQDNVQRSVSVRWPFADSRAKNFLDRESKQLPTNAPGLVMIDTTEASGAMKSWRHVVERRFQPHMYTRVSAVCLYSSGLWSTPDGEELRWETQLISNPYARHALPGWIVDQLQRFSNGHGA
ncbi:hypothetical protein [Labedaea rhizosphaerae]|uniref:Uncharacterized protein n=1 Tax=Labedaea rhizosphaerae TaxID=598644 RepID=A0A4R6SA52_LABRH|nr:hypothetical protein [Labedaea rhizosphaerae]TDP96374.1 hypothetical protein EV186_104359 [Labedaea rhizosphaerae]